MEFAPPENKPAKVPSRREMLSPFKQKPSQMQNSAIPGIESYSGGQYGRNIPFLQPDYVKD
jgi:hypothetical protein